MITCDVPGCENERIMSWRPIGHPRGYRVCRHHADRDHNSQDPFDLSAVFGLSRMQGRRVPRGRPPLPSAPTKTEADNGSRRGTTETNSPLVSHGHRAGIQDEARRCGCGAPLVKGKRYCDPCRAERRRATMRTYMRNRRGSLARRTTSSGSPQKAALAVASRRTGADRTPIASPPEMQTSV